VLEVSSPGLDRQLFKPADYDRFAGRLARVTYEDPETGKKKTDVARLKGLRRAEGAAGTVSENNASVLLEDGRTGEVREVPLNNVKVARLEIEL
jgi:ribosome maturation factor RimP